MTTNHPAPAEPVDLDALLSPAGPYETGPDAGNADGAQLVRDWHGNPTWWAPVSGCDSLDDLLFRIRSRILPHLRPPVIGIDIPGPDGDWADTADLCQAEGVPVEAGARLLRRARAAWGQQQPTPPAEGEVHLLAAWMYRLADERTRNRRRGIRPHPSSLTRAGAVIQQQAAVIQQQAAELAMLRQEAVPVPVDERPWENKPGWLDPDGECWWCPSDGPAYWSMVNPAMVYGGWLLPAHAIPVPPENRQHA